MPGKWLTTTRLHQNQAARYKRYGHFIWRDPKEEQYKQAGRIQ
jgi:hypothetical protein